MAQCGNTGDKDAYWNAYWPALEEVRRGITDGRIHTIWSRLQDEAAAKDAAYARTPRSVNIVVPRIQISDNEMPYLTQQVILHDPDDCAKIARRHVRKQPNFTPILFHGLISTTDNDHWKKQREHLNEVFLPQLSLSKIFPTSWSRAKHCATRMERLRQESGPYGVQVHDFFLHEAQAQLQLALFGMDEAFMDSTNEKIRQVFAGACEEPEFGKDMCLDMMAKVGQNPAFAAASDAEVLNGQKKIFGPLSKSVATAGKELGLNMKDQFGNMMLVLFAGHDTTAHTMTWLTFELARHPKIQARLQAEIDTFFDQLGGRDMVYEDCEKLPFLTRCTMETLRLWPAVGSGTYRQLQFDDTVTGPGGKDVTLPKGTNVQVVTWMRHRNQALWGADADEFNPDRDFQGDELWQGSPFKAFNPASPRFSPFTFQPRDCLGKNFAHMEIRVIIANLFRHFTFELSEPYAAWAPETHGPIENFQATIGPRDLTPEGVEENKRRQEIRRGPRMAMWCKLIPRRPVTPAAKL